MSASAQCAPIVTMVAPFWRIGADSVRQLSGMETVRAVRWFNAHPPPSTDIYTTAIVVSIGSTGVLLLGNGSEICRAVVLTEPGVKDLLRVVDGDRA